MQITRKSRAVAGPTMLELDDQGNSATWGNHVSDDEYKAAPDVAGRSQ